MYHPNYHIIQPKQHNYTYRTSTSKACRPATSASRLAVNNPRGHLSGTRLRHVQETCLCQAQILVGRVLNGEKGESHRRGQRSPGPRIAPAEDPGRPIAVRIESINGPAPPQP